MYNKNHFPEHIFDQESLIIGISDISYTIPEEILAAKPEVIIISLTNEAKENSIQTQQNTLNKLVDALNTIGRKAAVLNCSTTCFNQNLLTGLTGLRTLVFMGVKPFGLEINAKDFYKIIHFKSLELICCHTIAQMDAERAAEGVPSSKKRLWNLLSNK